MFNCLLSFCHYIKAAYSLYTIFVLNGANIAECLQECEVISTDLDLTSHLFSTLCSEWIATSIKVKFLPLY